MVLNHGSVRYYRAHAGADGLMSAADYARFGLTGARAFHSASQAVPSAAGSFSTLALNSATFDPGGMHSAGRLTVATAGYYLVQAWMAFAGNATGYRAVRVLLSGSGASLNYAYAPAAPAGVQTVVATTDVKLAAAGDYFEVQASQDSGGALNAEAVVLTAVLLGDTR